MGGPGVLRLGRALKLYTAHEYWLVCPTHVLFKFAREACVERQCLQCTIRARRPPQPWRYGELRDTSTKHVDQFLMPSRFALERHRQDGVRGPMTVLPNFVPTPSPPSKGPRISNRPFFVYVGRLEKLKGLQDLIEVFRGYRRADLLVVGDGTYAKTLIRQADGLPHVRFIGLVHPSKVGDYYRQAIAVLVPSLCYEVFPLTSGEALTYGTPVIARRIGALTEVIEESEGGYLFETPEECRDAMERLRSEPQLRDEVGARGRRAALSKWTTDVHLELYTTLVHRLLDQKRGKV